MLILFINNIMKFKEKHTFEERCLESDKIRKKYPDRIPIIVEKSDNCKDIIDIDKHKFLVPIDLTMGQFVFVVRKRLKLPSEKALFFFNNNSLPPTSKSLVDIDNNYKDKDGFLYFIYSSENTFGNYIF